MTNKFQTSNSKTQYNRTACLFIPVCHPEAGEGSNINKQIPNINIQFRNTLVGFGV